MKKVFIVLAILLVVAGAVFFFIAFSAAGYDLSKLGTAKSETNTYSAEGAFDKISIDTEESDVVFLPATDGKCRVVCVELEKRKHFVSVENGVLTVSARDERAWYERFSFFSNGLSLTVYLPMTAYESLTVRAGTGEVKIPADFSFGRIEILVSTGDVECNASASDLLKIEASTGDVKATGVHVGKAEMTISTGGAELSSFTCDGDLSIAVSTGKVVLSDLTCGNLTSTGRTGKMTMQNVRVTEQLAIERSTGDLLLQGCDAGEIILKTSTGDVTGTLLSSKIFTVETSTGDVDIPASMASGGMCKITTSTGDIEIKIAD